MNRRNLSRLARQTFHRFCVTVGAVALTLAFFLVLPLMQTIASPDHDDLMLTSMDTAHLPPPPPPPQEEEPEEEPEPEDTPPELAEEAPPLDLSQLELALNPGFSDSWGGGDFAVKLETVAAGSKEIDALFSLADLDQKPRILYQPSPVLTSMVRKRAPGSVTILFLVDEKGRVKDPLVQKSTDPVFERPALAAVKKWKFEPGKRSGKAVRFRMRVPITFPRG